MLLFSPIDMYYVFTKKIKKSYLAKIAIMFDSLKWYKRRYVSFEYKFYKKQGDLYRIIVIFDYYIAGILL